MLERKAMNFPSGENLGEDRDLMLRYLRRSCWICSLLGDIDWFTNCFQAKFNFLVLLEIHFSPSRVFPATAYD